MTAEEETRIKDFQQSQPAGEVEISSGQPQEYDFTSVAGMYNLRNNTTKLGDDFTGSVSCVLCVLPTQKHVHPLCFNGPSKLPCSDSYDFKYSNAIMLFE